MHTTHPRRHPTRRAALTVVAIGSLAGGAFVANDVVLAGTPDALQQADPTPPPSTPDGYARAVVAAWLAGDGATVVDLATSEVTQFLAAVPAGAEVT